MVETLGAEYVTEVGSYGKISGEKVAGKLEVSALVEVLCS